MYLRVHECVDLCATCAHAKMGFTVWILQVLSWVRESYNDCQILPLILCLTWLSLGQMLYPSLLANKRRRLVWHRDWNGSMECLDLLADKLTAEDCVCQTDVWHRNASGLRHTTACTIKTLKNEREKHLLIEILVVRVGNLPLFIKIIHAENGVQGRALCFSLPARFVPHIAEDNMGEKGNW